LIFFMAIVVLYGLAALGGTFKPKLGLDLAGGTQITLTAQSKGVNSEKMKEARSIIDKRVNGSGVVDADVTVQSGNQIVVSVPGKNSRNLIAQVERTAQLRFRLVATNGQIGPASTSTPTATPTSTTSPSATPTAPSSGSTKLTVNPTNSPTSSTSGKDNRPAPEFGAAKVKKPTKKATKKPAKGPTSTPTATPTTPSLTDSIPPSTKSDNLTKTLAWAASPPTYWQEKLLTYTCPVAGKASVPVDDNPDEPLVTCDASGNRYLLSKAVVEGTSLKSASAGAPSGTTVAWTVNLDLKGSAVKDFGTVSRALLANSGLFAVVLDGQVLSAPGFTGVITNGSAQITGSFTEKTASALANSLKFGALPIKFTSQPRVEIIGPSLAGDQLSAGILAGIIGLAIVMIYCFFYYRGLGLVVVSSLIIAAAVTYGTVLVLAHAAGFSLSLPGIAGLIVAVGITADSFIVYFERIRDEMRDGKSMRVAVEAGWIRARNTCLAADTVSLLAAVVLYIFAIGVVRGFAFALGISTLIDLVVFFFFTKPTVTLLAKRTFFNSGHRFSGLSAETLGVDALAGHTTVAGGKA
jgi:preprotein translocase subunit SecD